MYDHDRCSRNVPEIPNPGMNFCQAWHGGTIHTLVQEWQFSQHRRQQSAAEFQKHSGCRRLHLLVGFTVNKIRCQIADQRLWLSRWFVKFRMLFRVTFSLVWTAYFIEIPARSTSMSPAYVAAVVALTSLIIIVVFIAVFICCRQQFADKCARRCSLFIDPVAFVLYCISAFVPSAYFQYLAWASRVPEELPVQAGTLACLKRGLCTDGEAFDPVDGPTRLTQGFNFTFYKRYRLKLTYCSTTRNCLPITDLVNRPTSSETANIQCEYRLFCSTLVVIVSHNVCVCFPTYAVGCASVCLSGTL